MLTNRPWVFNSADTQKKSTAENKAKRKVNKGWKRVQKIPQSLSKDQAGTMDPDQEEVRLLYKKLEKPVYQIGPKKWQFQLGSMTEQLFHTLIFVLITSLFKFLLI